MSSLASVFIGDTYYGETEILELWPARGSRDGSGERLISRLPGPAWLFRPGDRPDR